MIPNIVYLNPDALIRTAEWLEEYRKHKVDTPHWDADRGRTRQLFHEDLVITVEFLRQAARDINEHAIAGMRN